MDREFNGLAWFFILAGSILLLVAAAMGGRQSEDCEEKGGILVKTRGGYECIKNLERVRP